MPATAHTFILAFLSAIILVSFVHVGGKFLSKNSLGSFGGVGGGGPRLGCLNVGIIINAKWKDMKYLFYSSMLREDCVCVCVYPDGAILSDIEEQISFIECHFPKRDSHPIRSDA